MAQFSVVLEDVTKTTIFGSRSGTAPGIQRSVIGSTFDNQRTEVIDAVDLQDAWAQARAKYYTGQQDPDTHILDVLEGSVAIQDTKYAPKPKETQNIPPPPIVPPTPGHIEQVPEPTIVTPHPKERE